MFVWRFGSIENERIRNQTSRVRMSLKWLNLNLNLNVSINLQTWWLNSLFRGIAAILFWKMLSSHGFWLGGKALKRPYIRDIVWGLGTNTLNGCFPKKMAGGKKMVYWIVEILVGGWQTLLLRVIEKGWKELCSLESCCLFPTDVPLKRFYIYLQTKSGNRIMCMAS